MTTEPRQSSIGSMSNKHKKSIKDVNGNGYKSQTRISASGSGEDLSNAPSAGSAKHLTASEHIDRCFDRKLPAIHRPCKDTFVWQRAKYRRDSCGSGIYPIYDAANRSNWCRTPLSTYQDTIGELGRQLLCKEVVTKRDVRPGPPCNMCINLMPLCRGYYRKYDCIRPCEEQHAVIKNGKKVYRTAEKRYWNACYNVDRSNINELAPHNVALGIKLVRYVRGFECSGQPKDLVQQS